MCGVEVATLKRDWTVVDRAEPETPEGAASALRTIWQDSQDALTGAVLGVVYVDGKLMRVFDRIADLNEYVPEVEVMRG